MTVVDGRCSVLLHSEGLEFRVYGLQSPETSKRPRAHTSTQQHRSFVVFRKRLHEDLDPSTQEHLPIGP